MFDMLGANIYMTLNSHQETDNGERCTSCTACIVTQRERREERERERERETEVLDGLV